MRNPDKTLLQQLSNELVLLCSDMLELESSLLKVHARDSLPTRRVTGAVLEDQVFVATGGAVFHGAHIGRESTVRVHAIVHLRTGLEPQTTVPIAWIAVGDPAQIFPPDKHDEIWAVQKPLNFPEWVYGFDRSTPNLMVHVTGYLSKSLEDHLKDVVLRD